MPKGAEIMIDYLIKEDVKHLFGVCGHGIIGFLDAAYDRRDEIATVTTHDERTAGFMADAYNRVSRRPAATYTSCGPGSVNLLMALANAFMDSSAVFAITGNVPTQHFNKGPFQETGRYFQGDWPSVVRNYVKRSYQAVRPEMVPEIMRQAYALMLSGRPGPVNVDVPLNVFVEKTDTNTPEPGAWRLGLNTRPGADPGAVRKAASLLASARRPVILAGNGVRLGGAQQSLAALVERFAIPVITTPLGKGVLDENHPLALGPTGRNGTYAANAAARNADVLLALGTRFDDRSTSGWIEGMTFDIPPTRLVQVDIDPSELGKNYAADLGIVADVDVFLRQLEDELDRTGAVADLDVWNELVAEWKAEWEAYLQPRRQVESDQLTPDRLVADIARVLPDDAVVLADVGAHHNWLLQQLRTPRRGQFHQAWGFAAMGFAVGGALGAKFARPEQPVLAVVGDGGFLMHSNAIATAVEYGLDATWIIWNNHGYGSIYGQQAAFFGAGREHATRFRMAATGELHSTDMVALSRAMGAEAHRIERPGDVGRQVETALTSGRPTVLEVRIDDGPQPSTGSWELPPRGALIPGFGWNRDRNEGQEREEVRRLFGE